MTTDTQDTDGLRAALAELLAAEEAAFPAERFGIEAQTAWAERQTKARAAARDALAATQQPAGAAWVGNEFAGQPPRGFASWHEWVQSPVKHGAHIQSIETAVTHLFLEAKQPAPSAPEQLIESLGQHDAAVKLAKSLGYVWRGGEWTAPEPEGWPASEHDRYTLDAMSEQPSAAVEAAEWQPDFEHLANEWADAATNGPCYLANVRDGIYTFDEALAGMRRDFEHCRKVSARVRAAAPPEPLRVGALSNLESATQFTTRLGMDVSRDWLDGWDACVREVLATLSAANTQPTSAAAPKAAGPFFVGNWYGTQGGDLVRIVGVANAGTQHETVFDQHGVHRYTREGDAGRCTGTAHDFSDPRNIRATSAAAGVPVELIEALRDIATRGPVEMVLDPQWAQRVACIALTAANIPITTPGGKKP